MALPDQTPGRKTENSGDSQLYKLKLFTGIVGLLAALVKLINELLAP